MFIETIDTIIVGAGVSGLYAASLLPQKEHSYVVLEARPYVGGRVLCHEYNGFYPDLGPSWYWPEIHPKMAGLIQKLNLAGYRQFEDGLGRYQDEDGLVHTVRGYANEPPAWRLCGGMQSLVQRLYADISDEAVRLNHPVSKIEKNLTGLRISVGELDKEPFTQFNAQRVILALPPRLAASTILFNPDLSHDLTQAMLGIGTWMAGQAKFFALYDEPIWRRNNLSGQAFSRCGPLCEIHDGSNNKGGPYALTGFVGIPAVYRDRQEKLTGEILEQLASIFGEQALKPDAFYYLDWAREPYTATEYDQPPMLDHPDYHPPAGRSSIWNGTVHFAGSETADQHGGYLEGALAAAERAVTSHEFSSSG